MDLVASWETLVACVALPLAMFAVLGFGALLLEVFVQKMLRQ